MSRGFQQHHVITQTRAAGSSTAVSAVSTVKVQGEASANVQRYLSGLRRPLLSREEEAELGRRIESGEREVLSSLLSTAADLRTLARIAREQRAVDKILRNQVQDPSGARAQKAQLSRVLDTCDRARSLTRAARQDILSALVDLRLHPRFVMQLEQALFAQHPRARRRFDDARRAREEIGAAKRVMIESNLRLVVSVAYRYKSSALSTLDLIQEGNIALIHATDKFDYRRGLRFSTYATYWIKQAFDRAIVEKASTIRIPVHLAESARKIRRAHADFVRAGDVEPSAAQLAERTSLPLAKVQSILGLPREPTSLDAPAGPESEVRVGDLVANDTSPAPEEEVGKAMLREDVRRLLRFLTPREREVVGMRFGLDGQHERTLSEIGVALSLTRERIRQIESRALDKLREHAPGLEL